jgi:hypothetical protein
MKIFLDVLFYYNYQFFVKVTKDPDPFFATKISIVFIFSMDFISLTGPFLLYFFRINYYKFWFSIVITCLVLLIYHLYYLRSGRAKKILKEKPVLFNSDKITMVIVTACTITVPIFTMTSILITRKVLAHYINNIGSFYSW